MSLMHPVATRGRTSPTSCQLLLPVQRPFEETGFVGEALQIVGRQQDAGDGSPQQIDQPGRNLAGDGLDLDHLTAVEIHDGGPVGAHPERSQPGRGRQLPRGLRGTPGDGHDVKAGGPGRGDGARRSGGDVAVRVEEGAIEVGRHQANHRAGRGAQAPPGRRRGPCLLALAPHRDHRTAPTPRRNCTGDCRRIRPVRPVRAGRAGTRAGAAAPPPAGPWSGKSPGRTVRSPPTSSVSSGT